MRKYESFVLSVILTLVLLLSRNIVRSPSDLTNVFGKEKYFDVKTPVARQPLFLAAPIRFWQETLPQSRYILSQ